MGVTLIVNVVDAHEQLLKVISAHFFTESPCLSNVIVHVSIHYSLLCDVSHWHLDSVIFCHYRTFVKLIELNDMFMVEV